jgi:benzoylformate decarboxylase
MYSIQALWSAAQLELPITYVILNNGRYAALQEFAPVFGFAAGDVVHGTELPGLDFVSLAKGMGCAGVRVTDAAKLRDVLGQALAASICTVVDVVVA